MKTTKPVLQVEDDENDVFLLARAMRKVGVADSVQVVKDGQEAIDYLRGTGKFVDREKFPFPYLVLLDLKLPHLMGLSVLKWIREQPGCAGLIVIMMSASAAPTDIESAYNLGANAFIVKPCETQQLENLVKAIKDFWLTYNVQPEPEALNRAASNP